ncbi:vWA domain-containing protein [Chryseobacterium wanjuense]
MKYFLLLFLLVILNCNKSKTPEIKKDLPQENIALLVDNSLTMLGKDFEPNRITVIKEVIRKIVLHKKENQAFSIVVFARNSYILCPLTKDKNQLLSAVNKLDTGIMKLYPGTNFSNVLLNGILSLSSEFDHKSMILFSDRKRKSKILPFRHSHPGSH